MTTGLLRWLSPTSGFILESRPARFKLSAMDAARSLLRADAYKYANSCSNSYPTGWYGLTAAFLRVERLERCLRLSCGKGVAEALNAFGLTKLFRATPGGASPDVKA